MRRFWNFLFLTVFCVLTASAYEKSIESYLSVDPLHPLENVKIDFNSGLSTPCGLSSFLISPRGSAYVNGNFDANIGMGFRRAFKNKPYTLGYHLLYDVSMQGPYFLHQCGFSAEYLTDDVDVRLNYYHPISGRFCKNLSVYQPQKWIEAEILYKFRGFSVGINPIYNVTSDILSLKPKVIIPFKYIILETGVHLSEVTSACTSYVNLSIPLYRVGDKPVGRCSTIRTVVSKCPCNPKPIDPLFVFAEKKKFMSP